MYKILIVDDEPVVRNGIKNTIDWNKAGFEFVGDCENGREAIEAVDALQPDVVLTDIYMPFVDGLELARYISEKFPHIKVIILTGYDDFEYAQQAVKLKVYDFLLKPITANELRKILEKVKNDLDIEAKKAEELNKLKLQLRESMPILRERFLERLVSGHLRAGELDEKLNLFGINFSGSEFISLVVDVDEYGKLGKMQEKAEDELLLFAVFNISEEIVSREKRGIVFQNRNNNIVIILSGKTPLSVKETAIRLADEIRQSVEKFLGFTITIGIGVVCSSLMDINRSYKGALSALDYRFVLGKNKVINITDMEHNNTEFSLHKMQWEKKIISLLKIGTSQEIDEAVETLIKDLKASLMPVRRCYIYIQQVITSVINTIDELGIDENEVFDGINPFTEVYKFKTLDEMSTWLKKLCSKAAKAILDQRSDYSKVQVERAIEYIRQNYNDTEISLNSVCKHLFISVSYFSLIFKNNTGKTFIEYLTSVRIEKAMELLRTTNLRSYEISKKVGYDDPHYFSSIFKKETGMSPTEYREKASGTR
ncbi:MAG TPA: response regulator [Clostridiaceae bacterium]|nr:response regulator [Clostridiaceae bacterium]